MKHAMWRSVFDLTKSNKNALIIFTILSIFYSAWMTGFTFTFSETDSFPSYNMLAKSFLKGQLSIDENPPVDYLQVNQKKYIYFGPVPTVFHIPSLLLGGSETPTGLIIAFFLAGACAIFYKIIDAIKSDCYRDSFVGYKVLLTVLFAFNGYSLLMASIPSIHHEAICAGMCFLLIGIYYVIKAVMNGYKLNIYESIIIGFAFSLSIGSRFSYVFTVAFLIMFIIIGVYLKNKRKSIWLTFIHIWPMICIPIISVGLLLIYNYARFDAFLNFGIGNMATLFWKYFENGNYFRYDHIPYNIWDYFFRVPEITASFPYFKLPYNILRVIPRFSTSYTLIHCNELSASVFIFMPILIFSFIPLFPIYREKNVFFKTIVACLWVVMILQLLPLSMTVGSIARYYYDFVPLMMLLAYLGISGSTKRLKGGGTVPILSLLSLLFSFAIVVNALHKYSTTIPYTSPLLKFF